MRCQEFEALLEQKGMEVLPGNAQEHLSACDKCEALFADLQTLTKLAEEIPAEVEVPQRVWVRLRAQLEAEQIIREPEVEIVPVREGWWTGIGSLLKPQVLATAGLGAALALGLIFVAHKPTTSQQPASVASAPAQVDSTAPPSPKQEAPAVQQAQKSETAVTVAPAPSAAKKQRAPVADSTRVAQVSTEDLSELRPSPSEEMYPATLAALNQAEQDVNMASMGNPVVEAELRKDLKTVNEFIAECQKYLKKHPKDQLAREYLDNAYRQKAELLTAMLDSGRGEQ